MGNKIKYDYAGTLLLLSVILGLWFSMDGFEVSSLATLTNFLLIGLYVLVAHVIVVPLMHILKVKIKYMGVAAYAVIIIQLLLLFNSHLNNGEHLVTPNTITYFTMLSLFPVAYLYNNMTDYIVRDNNASNTIMKFAMFIAGVAIITLNITPIIYLMALVIVLSFGLVIFDAIVIRDSKTEALCKIRFTLTKKYIGLGLIVGLLPISIFMLKIAYLVIDTNLSIELIAYVGLIGIIIGGVGLVKYYTELFDNEKLIYGIIITLSVGSFIPFVMKLSSSESLVLFELTGFSLMSVSSLLALCAFVFTIYEVKHNVSRQRVSDTIGKYWEFVAGMAVSMTIVSILQITLL